MDNKPFKGYANGMDFWQDNVSTHGIDEALIIGGRYLDMQLKCKLSDDEKQFCRELFMTMFEASTDKINPTKLVYPYTFEEADKRTESSFYHMSRDLNAKCAKAIDTAINASCYETNYYNLRIAAMKAIVDYGFERVNLVLAFNLQHHESDGRYSSANKRWAKGFTVAEQAFNNTWLRAHATLIDSFTEYTRKLYTDLDADRFALLGKAESGEFVHGYEITRSIMVDDKQGYAIARNPNAVSPWVCWQFYIRDDGPSYNWGTYVNAEQEAIDNYNARIFVAFN